MSLTEYHRKRDFNKTAEPKGTVDKKAGAHPKRVFVIQKHAASHLHYDFRLELDGVLKSWAVPKGPSMNPKDKRLAMQVEDHPIEYGDFEGIIPAGEYGGGTVMLWDTGEWEPLDPESDPLADWHKGNLKIRLKGERLQGGFALFHIRGGKYGGDDNKKSWLLIKERDDHASEDSITEEHTTSVTTGRTMEEIAAGKKASKGKKSSGGGLRVWTGTKDAQHQSEPVDPASASGARKAAFPAQVKPQLATLVQTAPRGESWVHEIKFDGYRFLAHIQKGRVSLITRNGKDWTDKFPGIEKAFEALPVESAIVDGELVALDDQGVSRFQLLQNSLDGRANPLLAFFAFDLLYLNGYSLKKASLADRKSQLRNVMQALPSGSPLRFSEHFTESGEDVWEKACQMGLEGIISKDLTVTYEEKRSKAWVKVKCSARQEFVIGGFTEPSGSRQGFGALLVGYYNDQDKLVYAGKVGTGFTDASLQEMLVLMEPLQREKSPFTNTPRGAWVRSVHWIEPELIAEVAYTEMTEEGMLRHPSFQGLREDKPAEAVIREIPQPTKAVEKAEAAEQAKAARPKRTKTKASSKAEKSEKTTKALSPEPGQPYVITSPEKVLFPEEGYTKQDLADYYRAVQERAYPWMANRPITLVRCPAGRTKPCFYQRHNKATEMPGIEPVDVNVKSGTETYIYMADPIALQTLVQQSTLEIHGWQAKVRDMEHPDRMIFDIDPSEEVGWEEVVAAAKTVKALLEKCGFVTFVMTTGGKGLHVVTPLKPKADWDEVITFADAIARFLEVTQPDKFTANLSKKKRVGRVFVDYLRNHKTASAVLPYSSRARAGATVATPVTWREVTPKLDPSKFTIKTVPGRIARQKADPWDGYEEARRELILDEVIQHLQNH